MTANNEKNVRARRHCSGKEDKQKKERRKPMDPMPPVQPSSIAHSPYHTKPFQTHRKAKKTRCAFPVVP